jgi:hypothetical protein
VSAFVVVHFFDVEAGGGLGWMRPSGIAEAEPVHEVGALTSAVHISSAMSHRHQTHLPDELHRRRRQREVAVSAFSTGVIPNAAFRNLV